MLRVLTGVGATVGAKVGVAVGVLVMVGVAVAVGETVEAANTAGLCDGVLGFELALTMPIRARELITPAIILVRVFMVILYLGALCPHEA